MLILSYPQVLVKETDYLISSPKSLLATCQVFDTQDYSSWPPQKLPKELEMMFEEAKFEDGDTEQLTYKDRSDLKQKLELFGWYSTH